MCLRRSLGIFYFWTHLTSDPWPYLHRCLDGVRELLIYCYWSIATDLLLLIYCYWSTATDLLLQRFPYVVASRSLRSLQVWLSLLLSSQISHCDWRDPNHCSPDVDTLGTMSILALIVVAVTTAAFAVITGVAGYEILQIQDNTRQVSKRLIYCYLLCSQAVAHNCHGMPRVV